MQFSSEEGSRSETGDMGCASDIRGESRVA